MWRVKVGLASERSYSSLLKRAYSKLPKEVYARDRFEVPKPKSEMSGNRTFLYNFREISDRIRRDSTIVLKYLSKELGTSGVIEGDYAVFKGRFSNEPIEKLVRSFVEKEVLCPVCKQPDTRVVREGRIRFLVCDACGAKSSVR